MRNISFALTTLQIINETKTVTRRLGWLKLKVGDQLCPVKKSMGLKFGEKIDVIKAPIRVVSLKREPLSALLADEQYGLSECAKEGFPNLTVEQFIQMFCESHKGCTPDTPLTRIEFSYEVNPND